MRAPRWLMFTIAGLAVALAAGFWFATGGIPDREVPAWVTAQPIAHRGQWTEGPARPENSLASFEQAAQNGFAIELDVQLSSDNQVVVFHDDDLDRLTDEAGAVGDMPLTKLRRLRLLDGNERIPTLHEALEIIDGRVPVFVEIKNRDSVGTLEDKVAREVDAYDGEAAIMSFNPYSMAQVAKTAPGVTRGQLSSALRGEDLAFYEAFLLRNLMMNWTSKPDFIAYDLEELPTFDTTIQRWRGRPLLGWTAHTPKDRLAGEEICDAVICDPEALP